MAITWGPWVQDRFRCGLDMIESPSTVGPDTATVQVTTRCYIQTKYYGWDSGINWTISGGVGSASGTTAFNHTGDMQYTLMGTKVTNFSTSYSGPVNVGANGSVTGWAAYSGTATVSKSTVIDQRPVSAPAAPSSVSVARVSDTQHTVTWTRNATTEAPYNGQSVSRYDNVTDAYVNIANISGTATSYSDTTTVADRQYRYRIEAYNDAGYSGWAYSGFIKTTPSYPYTPTATKDASGNIIVTIDGISEITEQVEVWHAADGTWDGTVLATLNVPVSSYTHVTPNPSVTHKYRLKAKIATPALTSAYSGESNTVQLQAPPNAPTNLAPNATAADATAAITLSWQHNPVDTTAQRKVQMQYRVDGGSWNDAGVATQTNSTWNVPANTWTNGHTIEWQVWTWGAATTGGSDGTGRSPASAIATITTSAKPTASINTPGSTLSGSVVSVTWGYFDPESTAQTSWIVTLYAPGGAILEQQTGSGTGTSTTLSTAVQDSLTYTVGVKVRDTTGTWSDEDTQAFTVSYAKPPQAEPAVTWTPESGSVGIEASVRTNLTRTNMVTNPSFETNLTGWTQSAGTMTRDDTEFYSGAYSMKVTGATGWRDVYSASMAATASLDYALSVAVKGSGSATIALWNQNNVKLAEVVVTLGSSWQRVGFTGVAPTGTTSLYITAGVQVVDAEDVLFADAFLLEQADTVMNYIEGTVNEPAAIEVRVFRSIDGGATWEILAAGIPPGSAVTDPIPPLNSNVLYMVETISATPSAAQSEPVEISTTNTAFNRVWLNFGDRFSEGVYLAPNVKIKVFAGKTVALQHFAGRSRPVEFSSVDEDEVIDVKGLILRDQAVLQEPGATTSTYDEWYDAIMKHDAPMCFRDLRGHRWFVSVEALDWDGPDGQFQELNFRAYQVDWTEPRTPEELAAL